MTHYQLQSYYVFSSHVVIRIVPPGSGDAGDGELHLVNEYIKNPVV